jgi:hypothetical protein
MQLNRTKALYLASGIPDAIGRCVAIPTALDAPPPAGLT